MPVFYSNFKTMSMCLFSLILVTGFVSGCASTEKFPPLERARAAYANAEANPIVKTNAPVALYEADKALKKAEMADDLEEKRHLSYLAEKNAEMAMAVAEQKEAEKEMALLKKEKEKVILESHMTEAEQARTAALTAREESMRLKAEAEAKAKEAEEALAKAAELEKELANLKAVQTDRGVVLTLGDVLFATGKAEMAPGAKQTMDYLAAFLNKYLDRKVLIEGHTDSTGSAELNLDLSERRAQSVKIALLERGIAFDRIDTIGYGKDKPIADNDTASGRQMNRRVEIVISKPVEPEPASQTK